MQVTCADLSHGGLDLFGLDATLDLFGLDATLRP